MKWNEFQYVNVEFWRLFPVVMCPIVKAVAAVWDSLAWSVPEAAQFLSMMSMSFSPMRVDCRPILTSTASMLGECMPQ